MGNRFEGEIPISKYDIPVANEEKAEKGQTRTHYDLIGNTLFKDWIIEEARMFEGMKVIVTVELLSVD